MSIDDQIPYVDDVELPKFNNSIGGQENFSTGTGDVIRALGGWKYAMLLLKS